MSQDKPSYAAAESAELVDPDEAGRRKVLSQWQRLPAGWRRVDVAIMGGTQWLLCLTGALFAIIITVEVLSRYVFGFSIYVTNALSRLLLVWFFMVGAGIAMRHGAHVGFELVLSRMSPRKRYVTVQVGLVCAAAFSLQMLYAGIVSLGPAWRQNEPGLDIPLAWPILAIPVGFAFLLYHIAVIMYLEAKAKP
jgi:TRAP-type C4-dicarboxylate transport system permease small subunit